MQSTEECYYYQEKEQETGGFHSATTNRLKMLTLNNNNNNNASTQRRSLSSYSSAAAARCRSSTKRRSPSSSLQQPSTKKQLLSPPPLTTAATVKNPTPINTPPPSPASILRRCISNPQSPENTNTILSPTTPSPAKGTSPRPPLPRALRRSLTDPLSRSPSSSELGLGSRNRGEDSPCPLSLNALKERMGEIREMIQWYEQVMGKEEVEEEDNEIGTITEEVEAEEEAVSVERTGECLVLHFNCPCQKGYQILLSGNNCYYKLM